MRSGLFEDQQMLPCRCFCRRQIIAVFATAAGLRELHTHTPGAPCRQSCAASARQSRTAHTGARCRSAHGTARKHDESGVSLLWVLGDPRQSHHHPPSSSPHTIKHLQTTSPAPAPRTHIPSGNPLSCGSHLPLVGERGDGNAARRARVILSRLAALGRHQGGPGQVARRRERLGQLLP